MRWLGNKSAHCVLLSCQVVKEEKSKNNEVTYVCDPVIGDNGSLYVPHEVACMYRDQVVQVSDILTPNQTELEFLTNMKIKTEADALSACGVLHSRGPHTVVCRLISIRRGNPKETYSSCFPAEAALV